MRRHRFRLEVRRNEGAGSARHPKIIRPGRSSLTSADELARGLGWFSIALGWIELVAPRRVTRTLGMQGKEPLVRAYGMREICAGMMALSPDKRAAGGAGSPATAWTSPPCSRSCVFGNPRGGNVIAALIMVGGVTALDYIAAQDVATQHDPKRGRR